MNNEQKDAAMKVQIEKDITIYPKHFFAYRNKTIKRAQSDQVRKQMDTLQVPEAPPPSPIAKKK